MPFESLGRLVSISIAIARNVLTSETASAPASSAAFANDAISVTSEGQLVADDTPEELAARAGKPRFVATLRQNGHSPADIRKAFSVIGDAQSVQEHAGAAAGEVIVEVVPKGNQDLRADIFQAAVSANLVLLGLEQHGENLEDIFRQLTTGNAGASS